MIDEGLLRALQALLDRLLAWDPEALEELAALEGRVVAVEVSPPGLRVLLRPGPAGLNLKAVSPGAPLVADVVLSGPPGGLARMLAEDPRRAGLPPGVVVRGDVGLAAQVRDVAARIRPDLEEPLARLLGDLPAHQLGRAARALLAWGAGARERLVRDTAEFLVEESGLLPPRDEVEESARAVEDLRDYVERLEARVRRLEVARGDAAAGSGGERPGGSGEPGE